MDSINQAAETVKHMEDDLRQKFLENGQEIKLWENTHIKHQIDRRENGDVFSLRDHIRAMVYSMLSSESPWERMETALILKQEELFP